MFGYVTIAAGALGKEAQERYRAHYCGLCHALHKRYGPIGQMTLSYDMTFLYILLSSLYEPETTAGTQRCLPHPVKPHDFLLNELAEYCCDMNMAVAYHKCLDNWQDDHSVAGYAEAALLRSGYSRVQKLYPEKCAQIEACLHELAQLEKAESDSTDAAANLSARMLGILYRYQEDLWADTLQKVGEGLGRFIYVMDAYDDLERDQKRGRYNPLRTLSQTEDYEERMYETLKLLIAECTDAFETLPLVQDMDILRNILYAGCWSRYQRKKLKREKSGGVPAARSAETHKEDGA